MSNLLPAERSSLEQLFGMAGGYVLDFSDTTFAHFFSNVAGIDIHASKYTVRGTSKANKLRTFWQVEPGAVVGKVLLALCAFRRIGPGVPVELDRGFRGKWTGLSFVGAKRRGLLGYGLGGDGVCVLSLGRAF